LVAAAAEAGVVAASAGLEVVAVVVDLAGSAAEEGLEVAAGDRAGDEEPRIEKTKQARSRLR
jgi:hypothetical protein